MPTKGGGTVRPRRYQLERARWYPKSEQFLGLITEGKEWMLNDTNEEYIGAYHGFSDGIYMTGGTPQESSKYLIPYEEITEAEGIYRELTQVEVDLHLMPRAYTPILTSEEYQKGWFVRYFVQRRNQLRSTIVEIDQEQFDLISTKNREGIDGNLFAKISINWKISGKSEEEIVFMNNKTLDRIEEDFPGLRFYLTNLLEYSQFTKIVPPPPPVAQDPNIPLTLTRKLKRLEEQGEGWAVARFEEDQAEKRERRMKKAFRISGRQS